MMARVGARSIGVFWMRREGYLSIGTFTRHDGGFGTL